MYIAEPLSARMRPYFFIALRITWLAAENPETLKFALRRRRMPIGGALALLEVDAECEAGGVNPSLELGTVKRMAWLIAPAATSS